MSKHEGRRSSTLPQLKSDMATIRRRSLSLYNGKRFTWSRNFIAISHSVFRGSHMRSHHHLSLGLQPRETWSGIEDTMREDILRQWNNLRRLQLTSKIFWPKPGQIDSSANHKIRGLRFSKCDLCCKLARIPLFVHIDQGGIGESRRPCREPRSTIIQIVYP